MKRGLIGPEACRTSKRNSNYAGDRRIDTSSDPGRQSPVDGQYVTNLGVRQRNRCRLHRRVIGIGNSDIGIGNRNRGPSISESRRVARARPGARVVGVEIQGSSIIYRCDMDCRSRRIAVGAAVIHYHRDGAINRARIVAGVAEYDLLDRTLVSRKARRTRQRDGNLPGNGGIDRCCNTAGKRAIDGKDVTRLCIGQSNGR
ncbi:hypothetical protein [Bradyrhizobium diazoefficiens]|uniref:hypothetical protein n=1 Tax=Bradyrhizobium diazoefficiens TaxID=1355477 RepID=UPI00272D1A8B|nr:hypothetical protein [Bradyrhizobium diazoefficiens]WLA68416.1 hypothetical protein QNN01_18150 [Bradyrhizobium diazoefficiens]